MGDINHPSVVALSRSPMRRTEAETEIKKTTKMKKQFHAVIETAIRFKEPEMVRDWVDSYILIYQPLNQLEYE